MVQATRSGKRFAGIVVDGDRWMVQRSGGRRGRGRQEPDREPLAPGVRIRDLHFDREGEILDVARQYTHPQAAPIFNYLVRWQDGQVQALGEGAMQSSHGIEILD